MNDTSQRTRQNVPRDTSEDGGVSKSHTADTLPEASLIGTDMSNWKYLSYREKLTTDIPGYRTQHRNEKWVY